MQHLVTAGELSAERAENLARALEEEITNVQTAVENQEEVIVDAIAEEQSITHLDAKFQIEAVEVKAGLADEYREEVEEELAQVQLQLERVQADLAQAVAQGTDVPAAATELVAEAQARLDECQNAYADGRYGESFGQFTAAKHLLDNAEGFLEGDVSSQELVDLVEFTQEQEIEDSQEYLDEYEESLDRWIEQHPEYADNFDNWAQQSRNELALYLAVSEESFQQLQTQLQEEGKNDEEIFETLTQYYRDEYERAFGLPYVPPVIEVVDEGSYYDPDGFNRNREIKELLSDQISTKGGFVQDYTYTDPLTGYVYEFTEEGYTYTTPLGLKYEEKFPEEFVVPTAYEQGNEQHSYTKETSEGIATYHYYATGYDVTLPDGRIETFAYPPGSYDLPEGGLFNYHPTGFEFRHDEEAIWYDYNPVYDTFVREDGEIYRPGEGVYFHEAMDYNYDDQRYEFADPRGTLWTYDPETHAWSSSDGEVYTPDATVIAPIGHEDEGDYQTELGEAWTWDEATQVWESNAGDVYHPESNTWKPGEITAEVNERYTFDPATGQYLDAQTGEPSANVIWSGVTWIYDSNENSWTSNTGETYSGGLHQIPSARNLEAGIAPYDPNKVYDFDPTLGKFIDPDTNQVADIEWSGVTWSRDAQTGEWSSNTGETRDADWAGDFNQDNSNNGQTGWSYDAESGGWTSPEGATINDPDGNPTAWQDDSGGWHSWEGSGTSADSGTPASGGDGGGMSDGGSSGDSGSSGGDGSSGDAGEGTGMVIGKAATESHSVTRWIEKFLGIKR